MRRLFLTAFLSACAFTLTASAQFPVTPPHQPTPQHTLPTRGPDPLRDMLGGRRGVAPERPNVVNPNNRKRSLEGWIVEVSPNETLLVVKQTGSGRHYNVILNAMTKLKAEGGTDLAGRKDLKIDDLKPGHIVKITYSIDVIGPQVHEVRLRRKKS